MRGAAGIGSLLRQDRIFYKILQRKTEFHTMKLICIFQYINLPSSPNDIVFVRILTSSCELFEDDLFLNSYYVHLHSMATERAEKNN